MTSETFFGRVNNKMKKPKLVALATSLNIDPVPEKVSDLVSAIKKHIDENPQLATDPKYQGLFVYRTNNGQSQKLDKKSSDKDAEDLAAAAKDAVGAAPVSGAHKILMEGGYTADPPAQHTRLTKFKNNASDAVDVDDKSENESQSQSTPPHKGDVSEGEDEDDHQATPLRVTTTVASNEKQLVVVSFQPKNSVDPVLAEDVLVELDGSLVSVVESEGRQHFRTSLSELVPRAMENISPKKAADTRIWRPGFSQNAAQLQIGSVGAFLSGEKPRSLAIPKLDEIELRAGEDGLLICDLFLDEGSSAAKTVRSMREPSLSPIKPLEMARFRREAKAVLTKPPRKLAAFIDKDEEFLEFLRDLLGIQPRPARAENVGLMLDRYLALEAGYQKLTDMNWGRTKGGYRVPADDPKYPEQEFTKQTIQQAFNILPALVSNDAAVFEASKLINCPDIREWIADPNGEHKATFSRMSLKNFREYIRKQDEKKEKEKERKRHHKDRESNGHASKKRKHAQEVDDSDDLDS